MLIDYVHFNQYFGFLTRAFAHPKEQAELQTRVLIPDQKTRQSDPFRAPNILSGSKRMLQSLLMCRKFGFGRYLKRLFFPKQHTQQTVSDIITHYEAYTNGQINMGETNLKWQILHRGKCKHCTEGTMSYKNSMRGSMNSRSCTFKYTH